MTHDVGTTAEISDVKPLEGGRYYISTTGRKRFRVERVIAREPYMLVDVTYVDEDDTGDPAAIGALIDEIRQVFREYLRLLVEFSGMAADIELPEDPLEASFLIGDALQVADSMKQRLLELSDTEQRLTVELGFLRRLLPQLRSLLERKREAPVEEPTAPGGGTSRADQEKFFASTSARTSRGFNALECERDRGFRAERSAFGGEPREFGGLESLAQKRRELIVGDQFGELAQVAQAPGRCLDVAFEDGRAPVLAAKRCDEREMFDGKVHNGILRLLACKKPDRRASLDGCSGEVARCYQIAC